MRSRIWLIAVLPMAGLLIAASPRIHAPPGPSAPDAVQIVVLQDIDSGTTSPTGNYRWLDAADQPYSDTYAATYDYTQATVEISYQDLDTELRGTLTATDLKPNFAYQLKLAGYTPYPDQPEVEALANERIGLAGRWWQEEWNGSAWANGKNLNDKDDGSSPNPNDEVYFARSVIYDGSSPIERRYRYNGYLVLDYFITDGTGAATVEFTADSSYHVLWKTSQRSWTADDGPQKTAIFDADLSAAYEDTGGDDFPLQTVTIFGEWERLPTGGVYPGPGDYVAQVILTEESFHGTCGTVAGCWAGAMGAEIAFTLLPPPPLRVADLAATRSDEDLLLTWSPVAQDTHGQPLSGVTYNVYRADHDPYLTPGAPLVAGVEVASHTDLDALADPSTNRFYFVTALDGSGHESDPSDRVGFFHLSLVPGASTQ